MWWGRKKAEKPVSAAIAAMDDWEFCVNLRKVFDFSNPVIKAEMYTLMIAYCGASEFVRMRISVELKHDMKAKEMGGRDFPAH